MINPATTAQPSPVPSNYLAMRTYLSYGLSVIPLNPKSKAPSSRALPNRLWRTWQERLAREDELREWQTAEPDAGIGIVCGLVSGGDSSLCLTGLDVDDIEFSQWIENTAQALIGQTWVVRTGSGKLHIYLYSRQAIQTSAFSVKGRRAADIRAHGNPQVGSKGSFLAAPPTIHPVTGACYMTISNGPEHIAQVDDAFAVYKALFTAWSESYDLNFQRDPRGKTIAPPCDDATRTMLMRKMAHEKVPGYIRRAVMEGADPGEGDWPNAPSYSDIDYGVVVQLLRCNFIREDIEGIFSSFAIGENCYRNDTRADHGWLYLDYTLRKAAEELRRQKEAQSKAQGDNFVVERVVRVDYDSEPEYQVTLHFLDTDKVAVATMRTDDINSERLFKNAVTKGTAESIVLPVQFRGKSFDAFSQLLTKMTEREGVPLEATGQGHLRMKAIEIFQREMLDHRPVDRSEMRIGWYDEQARAAFVAGGVLISRLTSTLRPAPRPEQVWQVLRALGGSERNVVFSGTRERMWALPLGPLREAMGMGTESHRASLRIEGNGDDD